MTAKMIVPTEKPPFVHAKINRKPVNMDSIEAITKDLDKPVTGTFINVEYPGHPGKVCGKFYKGMEYFNKTFEDNERCTIPWSVARFINERCFHEQHSYLLDDKGNPIKSGRKIFRYKFMIESM